MKASVSGPSKGAGPPPGPLARHWPFWLVLVAAAAFFATHVPFLPLSLEDIDSINFALGLRHFDLALHQPHPPGYPVYIALGKLSLAVLAWAAPAMASLRVEAVALAVWSLAGGTLAVVGAWLLAHELDAVDPDAPPSPWAPFFAATMLAVSPLFSISALRPLSDMPGLAVALLAQALLVRGLRSPGACLGGALVAGLAAGIRSQTAVLTVPLLLGVLAAQQGPAAWRTRRRAAAALTLAGLSWGVPLLVLSGGPAGYLRALGSQAGEDFSWVDMLWSNPTPRRLALSLYETFAQPWAAVPLAGAVAALALAGAAILLRRSRRALALACLAFAPYAVFHLLFQETATVRYALPLLVPSAWLAARAVAAAGRLAAPLWGALTVSGLLLSVPGAIEYGQQAHPAFRAVTDMISEGEGFPSGGVYSHFALYRALQAGAPSWLPVMPSVPNREWLGPVNFFRNGGAQTLWFLADPRRTDLALFDPASLLLPSEANPWLAGRRPEMGGARPIGAVWYRLAPPRWMAGEGWSLTPETGGLVRATRAGLDHRPIEAYVQRRPEPVTLMIGGFHLGPAADPATELTISLDGTPVDTWVFDHRSGGPSFLRFVALPAGIPAGPGLYATLSVSARSTEPGRAVSEVAIRQFDLQSTGVRALLGFGEGWHEDEFEPSGLRWRWTSERAVLRIASSRAVRLTIRGESPLKYFDGAPTVRISAGGRTLGTFHPVADFEWHVTVPADALSSSGGAVTIETDRIYMPGAAEGSADTRRLGLRVFECRAEL